MPESSPQTLIDRLESESVNVHPTLGGGMELLRDNVADNQHFIDIDEYGDAEGYPFDLPVSAPTAWVPYASDVNKSSLRKHGGVPLPFEAGWDFTEPWLPNGTMPIGSPEIAAFGTYRPPPPIVISVAGGKAGYTAGERELFMTFVSRGGRHSLPSDGVAFTLTSGQGFTVILPDDLPTGVRIGWWLTTSGGGRDTARLQRITLGSNRSVRFAGPYRSGRKMPARNETELSAPKRMRYGKANMVFRQSAPGNLWAGDYRFTWAKTTAFGTTRVGPWSDVKTVEGDRTLGGVVSFTGGVDDVLHATHSYQVGDAVEVRGASLPAPLVSGNTYFVIERTDTTFRVSATPGGASVDLTSSGSGKAYKVTRLPYKRNACWRIRKPERDPDMTGWILYVQKDGVSYRVQGTGSLGGGASYLGFGRVPVRIYGDTRSGEEAGRTNLFLVSEDPPAENTSGIEAPGSAPDAPATFQASTSLAATGKRKYAYAEVVQDGRGGEKLSLPSKAVTHTTAAGEYVRMIPPDPNNIFPNAEGRERGSDGIPLNMSVSGANGRYYYDTDTHKHVITTDGTAYASGTAYIDLGARVVNTSMTYCFRGILEAEIVAGTARVVLLEYDANGVLIGSGRILKAIASSGTSPFAVRLGPNGDAAWTAGTVTVAMRLQMADATRNMTARAYNLAGHPYPMIPRKVQKGDAYEPANFDPPYERPFPRGVMVGVGPAPVTSGTIDPTPPIAHLDFTKSATLTEAGWTHNAPGIISQVETISGTRVWRLHDSTRDTARHGYMEHATTGRSSLAGRIQERAVKMPDSSGNYVEKIRLLGGNGYYLGSVRFYSENGVRLEVQDTNGVRWEEGPFVGVYTNDELDYELIASGVGTKNGTLTLLLGRGGSQRQVVGQISSIDWTGRTAGLTRFGVTRGESNPNTTWQFYAKTLTVTESGAPIGEAAAPPAGESVVPPDRPTNSYPVWTASTAYSVGSEVVPTVSNGRFYRATVAGTSGTAEPSWPTTDTVTDGTVTWEEAGGIYIETDEDGETINQLYVFVPPYYVGDNRFDVDNVARWPVVPGKTYSFAVRGRHTVPADTAGSRPWLLTLYNPTTGEEKTVGHPYGALGATGTAGWAERPVPVTPEEGFIELRAHFKNMGTGLYLFQDVALTQGASVVRGYGVASAGWMRTILKGETPYISRVAPRYDVWWRSIGAPAEIPENTSATPTYEHSLDLSSWTAFEPEVDGLPEYSVARYGAIRLDLTGNGRETPYIPPGSPYLSWDRMFATLCREDGTSFEAGAVVGGFLPPIRRPEYVSDTVGGHNLHTDTTEAVNRVRESFVVGFLTEADANLFVERCLDENWVVEAPKHGGTVRGMRYLINIDEEVGAPQEIGTDPIFDGFRNVVSTVEVSGAEVIEENRIA